ncbi:MAG: hypothetical protein JO138_01580 [Acidobacteriaceae bacterium]|nr:hypothetical protein [Acidobacteriaceae bacterium]
MRAPVLLAGRLLSGLVCQMRRLEHASSLSRFTDFLVCAADLSSKDKAGKVPFQQMVAGMRDAFNCGVVVEKYLSTVR